jgi:hypothetical protein
MKAFSNNLFTNYLSLQVLPADEEFNSSHEVLALILVFLKVVLVTTEPPGKAALTVVHSHV